MDFELKSEQKEILLLILEEFYEKNGDFSYLCEDSDISDTDKYVYSYGASKGVIIPLAEDAIIAPYVLKIPFSYEDKCCEVSFEKNYCQMEEDIGIAAEEEELSDIFIPTKYLCTFSGTKVYTQPLVNTSRRRVRPYSYEILSNDYGIEELSGIDPNLSLSIVEYYGIDKFLKMREFIEKKRINDLHGGNYGYIGDRPVIFDYCGYYGPEGSYNSSCLSGDRSSFYD